MVIDSDIYRKQGISQGQRQEPLLAVRGNIYDTKNVPLTRNIIQIKDKARFADLIYESTGRKSDFYLNKLNSKADFVYLERNLRKEKVALILGQRISGLVIDREFRRSYPHNNIGSQIIGFTDVDDKGLIGIEKEFNGYLEGKNGWVVKQVDGEGRAQVKTNFPIKDPVDGSNIQLTINLEYQSILQEELARRIEESKAKGAMGILMDPQTGAILAMTSLPDFDPNQHDFYPLENQKIRVVTDQFEPGSTYKIVAATAAVATKKYLFMMNFIARTVNSRLQGK